YTQSKDSWTKASQIDELGMFFKGPRAEGARSGPASGQLIAGLRPGMLRRVKILSDMSEQQLGRFAQYMEVQQASQFREIVKQGEKGDAMYLILEGEVRVRQIISGKETVLATMLAGEFFGDISLFDHGPRSA